MKNRVQLIGNLGNTPESNNVGNSVLSKFSIANRESWQDAKGEWQENTYWHQVVAWGKLAERVASSLKKGDKIALEGRLVSRNYEDKEGQKHYITEIVLNNYETLLVPKGKEMKVA